MHIPKTGGTSLIADLRNVLPDDIYFGSEEICWSWVNDILTKPEYQADAEKWRLSGSTAAAVASGHSHVLTVLRWPREHVVSQFWQSKHFFDAHQVWPHMEPFLASLGIMGDRETAEASLGHWLHYFAGAQRYQHFRALDYLDPYNMQTRFFTCPSGIYGYACRFEQPLELALQRMENVSVVGILPFLTETRCLLELKVLGVMPALCECTSEARRKHEKTKKVTTWGRPHPKGTRIAELEGELLGLADSLTADDVVLYAAAARRFERDVQRVQAEHGVRLLCGDGPTKRLEGFRPAAPPIRLQFLSPDPGEDVREVYRQNVRKLLVLCLLLAALSVTGACRARNRRAWQES